MKSFKLLRTVLFVLATLFASRSAWCQNATEYQIAWNEEYYAVEVPIEEGTSLNQLITAVESYIASHSFHSWLSLETIDSGESTESLEFSFDIADNTGSSVRSADFTPWGFRIIQAAQHSSGPVISDPIGGCATVYPGANTLVTVDNLISSCRVALKHQDLSGGVWSVVDSLYLQAPSSSFSRNLSDGNYRLDSLGLTFSVRYPDILYYKYNVTNIYGGSIWSPNPYTINKDGGANSIYISSYTDTTDVVHQTIDSQIISDFQNLAGWYNSGNCPYWNPDLQLSVSTYTGKILLATRCSPNLWESRTWDTGLCFSGHDNTVSFSQPSGGEIKALESVTSSASVSIVNTQYGVLYSVSDGFHETSAAGNGSSLTINLSGTSIATPYSVYGSFGGRRRCLKNFNPENDIPSAEGTIEASGPNSIRTLTNQGSANSEEVVIYDGLGRTKQEVSVRASGDGSKDVVRPIRTDHLGREWRSYLPYPSITSGTYRSSAFSEQASWWRGEYGCTLGSEYAYSSKIIESALSGRPLSECFPGEDYHSSNHDTDYNYTSASIPCLTVLSDGCLSRNGNYAPGTVSCVSTSDADGCVTVTWTDREGRTVATGSGYALAYYAYDDCGRLRWIVSPEGMSQLPYYSIAQGSTFASRYCFVYVYDSRGRLTEKQIPGATPQYFVYDAHDRLAFFQDGNMRLESKWKALFYDGCGRLVREDLRNGQNLTREQLQAGFDSIPGMASALYSTTTGVSLLDSFVWDEYPSALDSRLAFVADTVATSSLLRSSPKGLRTVETLAVLGTTDYATRASYYDNEDRVIQQVTLYPDGTSLRISNSYDIQGRVKNSVAKYLDSTADYGSSVDLEDCMFYDARGRVNKKTSCLHVGGQTVKSDALYEYDILGRPWRTKLDNVPIPLAQQTISYNMQGWESERIIKDWQDSTLFSSKLLYETPLSNDGYNGVNNQVSWSGSISSWQWRHMGQPCKAFAFAYDNQKRLSYSEHYSAKTIDYLHTTAFGYDQNTNITSYTGYNSNGTPNQSSPINYSGNQRLDYSYDSNGNITYEHSEWDEWCREVSYNILNLPQNSSFRGGTTDCLYLSDGTKWFEKRDADHEGRIYVGPFVYEYDHNYKVFTSCESTGGRIRIIYPGIEHGYDVLTILHQYFITDHLGNTRATIDTDGTLSGQADYLPYGRIFWENGVNYWKNRYLWTGKELLTTIFDRTVYDSGARFLFTDGSFASIDPYAEKYPWISPYAYCAGDPINLTDPDGNIIETLLDVASLVDGVRSFVSNVKQGNTGAAIVDGIGIVFDAAAVITPFMPGGASAGIRAVRALDKGADAIKAADRAGDVAKGMKNAERVAEGRQFEKDAAKAAEDAGLDVQTQVRLVPQNGKGNIKGNRSTVDQLIKNEDGTYTVVETKLTPKSKLSTGQKAVRDEVRKGSGSFKIKSSNKDLDDTSITVSRYVIHYNNPSYVNFK